jgi:hypothetical protein
VVSGFCILKLRVTMTGKQMMRKNTDREADEKSIWKLPMPSDAYTATKSWHSTWVQNTWVKMPRNCMPKLDQDLREGAHCQLPQNCPSQLGMLDAFLFWWEPWAVAWDSFQQRLQRLDAPIKQHHLHSPA